MRNLFTRLKKMDRNIWIQFFGASLSSISMFMLMPFFTLYLKDKTDSLFQVGIVIAIESFAAVLGSLIGGRLADTYGRKPMMVFSMFGSAVIMLGYIVFGNFLAYTILSAFSGMLNSFYGPAASAMIADVTEKEERTEAYGLMRMGWNIGAAIGPLIGAMIIFVPKALLFMIASGSLFLFALALLFLIRETKPEVLEKNEDEEGNMNMSVFRIVLQDRVLFTFVATGIIISMGFSVGEGMLPLHFDRELVHFTDKQNPFPYLMSMNGLMVVLLQFAISAWASNKNSGSVMLLGASLFGVGLLGIGWLPRWLDASGASFAVMLMVMMVVYAVYTFGEMVMSPVQMTFVANIAPEHLRGTYMGAANLQWIIGGVFGPLLGGYLFDRSLGNVLFTILGIGSLIAGVFYVLVDRYHQRKVKEAEEATA